MIDCLLWAFQLQQKEPQNQYHAIAPEHLHYSISYNPVHPCKVFCMRLSWKQHLGEYEMVDDMDSAPQSVGNSCMGKPPSNSFKHNASRAQYDGCASNWGMLWPCGKCRTTMWSWGTTCLVLTVCLGGEFCCFRCHLVNCKLWPGRQLGPLEQPWKWYPQVFILNSNPLDQLLHYQNVFSNDLAGLRLEFP